MSTSRERMAELRAKAQGAERLDPLEKARRNPKSRALAIAAKCWDCQGGDADPHPRWRIGNCQLRDCPLWPLRPHQSRAGELTPRSLRA